MLFNIWMPHCRADNVPGLIYSQARVFGLAVYPAETELTDQDWAPAARYDRGGKGGDEHCGFYW